MITSQSDMWPLAKWLTIAAAFILCSAAQAQETRRRTAVSGQETSIGGYASGDNRSCHALDPPPVILTEPPAHGIVCLRLGDIFVNRAQAGGSPDCIASKMRGNKVFYLGRKGFAGEDRVRFAVHYPAATQDVEVNVHVILDDFLANRPGAVNHWAPANAARQASGPIPPCEGTRP